MLKLHHTHISLTLTYDGLVESSKVWTLGIHALLHLWKTPHISPTSAHWPSLHVWCNGLPDPHLDAVIITVYLMAVAGQVSQTLIVHREDPGHPHFGQTDS